MVTDKCLYKGIEHIEQIGRNLILTHLYFHENLAIITIHFAKLGRHTCRHIDIVPVKIIMYSSA